MVSTLARRVMIAVLLVLLAFLITSPAVSNAEIRPLPLDTAAYGYAPGEAGYLSDTEYQDESIHVTVEKFKKGKTPVIVARIRIADPSQIRTAMSYDSYDKTAYVKAATMAKKVNAVLAINGDFFKYNKHGYLIRQGVTYREAADGAHDILFIDENGDFTAIPNGTQEEALAHIQSLEAKVINTFNFGPILVKDGEVQQITTREYQYRYKMARLAIAQIGPLEYAVFHCSGRADATQGLTLADFAAFIKEAVPEVQLAYNLDGGGSAHVIFHNKLQHKNPDARQICDILYFASAAQNEEE